MNECAFGLKTGIFVERLFFFVILLSSGIVDKSSYCISLLCSYIRSTVIYVLYFVQLLGHF